MFKGRSGLWGCVWGVSPLPYRESLGGGSLDSAVGDRWGTELSLGPNSHALRRQRLPDWTDRTAAGSDTSKSYTKVSRPRLQMCGFTMNLEESCMQLEKAAPSHARHALCSLTEKPVVPRRPPVTGSVDQRVTESNTHLQRRGRLCFITSAHFSSSGTFLQNNAAVTAATGG